MKVEESVNAIKITEAPGCMWIFGLFFVVIGGMLLWGTLGGFSNWNEIETWELAVAFLICVCGIAAGIWIISSGPITRVVIDRVENTVSVSKYSFSGKRSGFFRFDEVNHFCLIENTDSEGDPTWSIGLNLRTGETIAITSLSVPAEKLNQSHVFQFNEFMRKEMPSYENNIKLTD